MTYYRLLLVLASLALLASCAKNNENAPTATARSEHPILEGSLASNAATLLSGKYRSACDDTVESQRQEILQALHARESEIIDFQIKNTNSPSYRTFPFGPTYARELTTPAAAAIGWQEDTESWPALHELYLSIKDEPINRRWVNLNARARGTLVDDIDRIVKGFNYQLDKESDPKLEALWAELISCQNISSCNEPALSPDSRAFVESQLKYKQLFSELSRASGAEEKREWLGTVIAWIKIDVDAIKFRKNPLVKKLDSEHYVLPLDLGPFSEANELFQSFFDRYWTVNGKSVKLEATGASALPDLFRVLLGTDHGGRSSVNGAKKTVTLNPGLFTPTVAHELGHVMGFRDKYYSVWIPENCAWKSQYNDEDLMSNSATGRVLDLHWAKLAEQY